MESVYLTTDNDIVITGLSIRATGAYLNSATVTATLRDGSLATVTGAIDLSCAYVAASNGNYLGVIPSTITLANGATYWLDVTTVSGGYNDFRRIECIAGYRGTT